MQNGSGTLALVMNGPGQLTLSGSNSYSGGTTVAGGTLSIAGDAALGSAPATAATNLTLNGGALTVTATTTISANRTISLGANGGTINITATSSTSPNAPPAGVLFAGQITGPGGLTVNGGSGSNLPGSANYLLVLDGAITITRAIQPSITRRSPATATSAAATA